MDDPQIHGTIEKLVARSMSCGSANQLAPQARLTASDYTTSGSRSISAGTCSGSDARYEKLASIRTRPPLVTQASSRATSSKPR